MDAAAPNGSSPPLTGPTPEADAATSSTPQLFTNRGYWRKCHDNAMHQTAPQSSPPFTHSAAHVDVHPSDGDVKDAALNTLPENDAQRDGVTSAMNAAAGTPPPDSAEPSLQTATHTDTSRASDRDLNGNTATVDQVVGAAASSPPPSSSSSAASSSSRSASSSSGIPTTGSRFDILMQSNSGAQGGSAAGAKESYRSVVRKATRACHHPQERQKETHEGSPESGAKRCEGGKMEPSIGASSPPSQAVVVGELMGIPTKPPFKRLLPQPFSHILVCDFEATCESGSVHFPHEIIEFPVVVIDTATLRVVAEFHSYVRPVKHPKLTRFCTELTGITQAMVDASDTLPTVVTRFQAWLETVVYPLCRAWREAHDPSPDTSALSTNLRSEQKRFTYDESSDTARRNVSEEKMICFATDGPWDMRRFMHECSVLRDGIEFPPLFYRYINVRHAFSDLLKTKQIKLTHMLKRLGMVFEGQRHSGICDTRNIARVLAEVMSRGYRVHHVSTIKYAHRGDRFLEHNQLARELLEEEEQEKLKQKQKKAAQEKHKETTTAGTQHKKGAPRNLRCRGKKK